MNWQEKKSAIANSLSGISSWLRSEFWEPVSQKVKVFGEEGAIALRKKQHIQLGVGVCALMLGGAYAFGILGSGGDVSPELPKKAKEPVTKTMPELSTPLSSVKDGDLWVSRIEKMVKGNEQEMEKLRQENTFIGKQVELLSQGFSLAPKMTREGTTSGNSHDGTSPTPNLQGQSTSLRTQGNGAGSGGNSGGGLEFAPSSSSEPQVLPSVSQGVGYGESSALIKDGLPQHSKKKRKLLHLSHGGSSSNAFKGPDTYLPAGTYFKVVTAMGVVVSTGTNSSSDPQPILLRIVDNGNLPGGLKGKVKDAVLIGTCYGSASAERAICRLKSLTWRDHSGRNIEKPVEGWIASEDGVQGIRAKIIDRSSEIAREAFGAGLLSAASNFLKFDASPGINPMSPFGQANAMGKGDSLKGALGTGAGSALDKLAEFSIKRAESMSPVAYVASGRVLDAVLMRGVDLSPLTPDNLQLVGGNSELSSQSDPNLSESNGDNQ